MNDGAVISESDFLKNMEMYYRKIKEKLSEDESDKILSNIRQLQFGEIYKTSN